MKTDKNNCYPRSTYFVVSDKSGATNLKVKISMYWKRGGAGYFSKNTKI